MFKTFESKDVFRPFDQTRYRTYFLPFGRSFSTIFLELYSNPPAKTIKNYVFIHIFFHKMLNIFF